MLDGLGCFRHLPDPGTPMDQSARDMLILRIIRERWVTLTNKKRGA